MFQKAFGSIPNIIDETRVNAGAAGLDSSTVS